MMAPLVVINNKLAPVALVMALPSCSLYSVAGFNVVLLIPHDADDDADDFPPERPGEEDNDPRTS